MASAMKISTSMEKTMKEQKSIMQNEGSCGATNKPKPSLVQIHVLIVDDDATSLAVVASMLRSCSNQDNSILELSIMTVKSGLDALSTLRSNKGGIDLVVSDLHMPEMNGIELQKHIDKEFKLPVIMMSADDKESVILESLESGAVYYMVKPVKSDDLKNVWQYAVKAKKGKSVLIEEVNNNDDCVINNTNEVEGGATTSSTSSTIEKPPQNKLVSDDNNDIAFDDNNEHGAKFSLSNSNVEGLSSPRVQVNGDQQKEGKKRGKDDNCSNGDGDDGDKESKKPPLKKPKVIWTNSLHNRFLVAVNHIGLERAVPKRILEFMNVPGLTRENVASHLQKYRIFLKRVAERCAFQTKMSDRVFKSSFAMGLQSSLFSRNIEHEFPQFANGYQQLPFYPGLDISNMNDSLNFPSYNNHEASSSNFMSQRGLHGQSPLLGPLPNIHQPKSDNTNRPRFGWEAISQMAGRNMQFNTQRGSIVPYGVMNSARQMQMYGNHPQGSMNLGLMNNSPSNSMNAYRNQFKPSDVNNVGNQNHHDPNFMLNPNGMNFNLGNMGSINNAYLPEMGIANNACWSGLNNNNVSSNGGIQATGSELPFSGSHGLPTIGSFGGELRNGVRGSKLTNLICSNNNCNASGAPMVNNAYDFGEVRNYEQGQQQNFGFDDNRNTNIGGVHHQNGIDFSQMDNNYNYYNNNAGNNNITNDNNRGSQHDQLGDLDLSELLFDPTFSPTSSVQEQSVHGVHNSGDNQDEDMSFGLNSVAILGQQKVGGNMNTPIWNSQDKIGVDAITSAPKELQLTHNEGQEDQDWDEDDFLESLLKNNPY